MDHPFLKNNKAALFYGFAWIVVSAVQVLVLTLYYQISPNNALISSLIFNFLYFLIGIGLWYPVRFIYQSEQQSISGILNLLGLGAGTVLAWNAAGTYLVLLVLPEDAVFQDLMRQSLVIKLILAVLVFLIITLVYYLILYFSSLEQRKVAEANLESLVRESELNLLKFKLNPHFLFNSLNSISALTMSKPEKAQEMIIKLSDYLRYSLESDKEPLRELKHELGNIRLYLEIERIRFGDRINYIEDLQEACLNQLVPGMILQPLFENAIKHGVSESVEPIEIKFRCCVSGQYLELSLSNEFVSHSETMVGTGTGLQNVQKRLQTMYDQTDLVHIRQKDRIFEVQLRIPLGKSEI